jgi:CheY-like chemotaxis protein
LRILIVDDDPFAGQMVAAILEELGHATVVCENAADAAQVLSEDTAIELLVSDMNMPLISGIDLFRELRLQGCSLPFVLLSGDDPRGLIALEPRLDGCVMKDDSLETTLAMTLARLAPAAGRSY